MAKNKNETALAAQNNNGFNQLADMNMAEMMAEELDGLDAGFERIKIPSAGSTVFEVPGEDSGEPETVKEFSAVILYHHPLFAYYKSKYTGGNNPPDCGSFDGLTGSLKEFTKYIKRLLGKGRKSNSVVTRFSLRKATNSGGLAYSQAQFTLDRPLTPEEHVLLDRMSEQVKTYSKRVAFEYDSAINPNEDHTVVVDSETGEIIEPLR